MQQQQVQKAVNKVPANFTHLLYTHEKEKGMLLSYEHFRKGSFVEASKIERSTFLTTMLLGSGTFLFNYLEKHYPDFQPEVVEPNGLTSTSFRIKYCFGGNEILIRRFMDSKKLLINPFAAENPENYSLLYAFDIKDDGQLNAILQALTEHLELSKTAYERLLKE